MEVLPLSLNRLQKDFPPLGSQPSWQSRVFRPLRKAPKGWAGVYLAGVDGWGSFQRTGATASMLELPFPESLAFDHARWEFWEPNPDLSGWH